MTVIIDVNLHPMDASSKVNLLIALVRRCVMKEAPHCLNERLAVTAEFGSRVTRGHDHNKLFVPQVGTEWYHKSFTFKGSQEWNSLPSEIRTLRSSAVFRTKLIGLVC